VYNSLLERDFEIFVEHSPATGITGPGARFNFGC
jgi:hypothetical protein